MEQKILLRSEQKTEDTWRLEDLFVDDSAYDQAVADLRKMLPEFQKYQGTLALGAENFLNMMKVYEKMNQLFERIYVYANQKNHQDTTDAVYQKMCGEADILLAEFNQSISWLEPEILAVPEDVLEGYFSGELAEGLKKYRRYIGMITRRREHVLDAEREALLSRVSELGQAPANIFSMFNNADITFPAVCDGNGEEHILTSGTFVRLLESKDPVLRANAFATLYSVYEQHQNTLAATYYANLKQADFFAKERNYKNAMDEALYDNEIPTEVYTNLIDTIHTRLPEMYEYVKLRKKILGALELHMYDVYVPLVDSWDKKYTFEEAKQIVLEGLAPLGEDYLALLQEGFDHRWIDVYENKGKRTGAYSWGAYGTHPYVLLNYHSSLNDVFTLAHEMGHSIHTYYSSASQSYLNAGYRIFVAEVASTCNESLLIHSLIQKSADSEEKKYLINYFLDQFKGTMYRQTMFAEFEMITHDLVTKGNALTAVQLKNIYLNLNKKYFGDEMISDPQIAMEWARIPHFYTPFYVYQYATGFAAAIAISRKILAGEDGIVEKYKKFLSGGCSMTPIELLKICDVDMSSPKPVEEALDEFAEYLKMLGEMV